MKSALFLALFFDCFEELVSTHSGISKQSFFTNA